MLLASWTLLASFVKFGMSDYGYGNYYYTDYPYNDTGSYYTQRQRAKTRIFDENSATLGFSLDASIPLDDLSSAIYISIPFSFSFPTASAGKLASYGTGRSLSGGSPLPTRSAMYRQLESYVARVTGVDDGHECLLRAMCETSATPLHDDGLIGDAINFLLTGSYSAAAASEADQSYFEAQAKGQLSGDCRSYHRKCPVSLFKYLG